GGTITHALSRMTQGNVQLGECDGPYVTRHAGNGGKVMVWLTDDDTLLESRAEGLMTDIDGSPGDPTERIFLGDGLVNNTVQLAPGDQFLGT
ncbi:MAG: hypothetical protein ACKPKO_49580, partial [Candidatus Fonsibacter sp.]